MGRPPWRDQDGDRHTEPVDAGDRRFTGFPPELANATRQPVKGIDRVADVLRIGTPMFARLCRPALIDGRPGIVVGPPGKVIGVVAMTMAGGRIRSIDIVADSRKLRFVTQEQPEVTASVEDVAPG